MARKKKKKKILFTFSRPLPYPFIWKSKSGETARSLTQLVSVNRGHFHSVCVFYKLLVHCSWWKGGPAAWDLSPGEKPAIDFIPYPAQLLPWMAQGQRPSSSAQLCIPACLVRTRYTQTSSPPHECTRVGLRELARTTHPPTPTPGNLSPINNSLLPIRNICETVKTFLLHLQLSRLLMLYRLWKPNQIKQLFEIQLGGVWGQFQLKTALGFLPEENVVTSKCSVAELTTSKRLSIWK